MHKFEHPQIMLKQKIFVQILATLTILLSIETSCVAQIPTYFNEPQYLEYFYALKEGNLIVVLSDRGTIREKLVKYGETDKLKKFDKALENEFNEIYSAFNSSYTFGSVYFIRKSELPSLLKKEVSKINFKDNKGNSVPWSQVNTERYLLGEFGKLDRRSRGPLLASKNSKKNESESSISAFFLMTPNEEIISKKFYLYQQTMFRSKEGVIKQFNKRLLRNNKMLSAAKAESFSNP